MMASMESVKYFCPAPFRDFCDFKHGGIVKASIRSAVAVGAFFVAYKTKQPGLTALATAGVSLPAAMSGVGVVCVYKGIKMIRDNWAKKAFQNISNGFALSASGYYILENYKHFYMYDMKSIKEYRSYKTVGRGILEDFLSNLHGNWVFWD